MAGRSATTQTEDFAALAAEFDVNDMAGVIARTPDQIEFALTDDAFPDSIRKNVDRVIVAGLGGSSLPADVVSDIFAPDVAGRIFVARSYDLNWPLDKRTLVLVASFSGGTEETLSTLDSVEGSDAQVVVITAGGELEVRARQADHPLILIPRDREPQGFQPRCATGYFTTYITRVLQDAGLIEDGVRVLKRVATFLRGLDCRSDAQHMASWLGHRIPLVYADQMHEQSLARITKIKVNENAKRPAFYNVFPEANHNEMIGMSGAFGEYGLLYLHDPSSHPRIRKRYEVMRDVFQQRQLSHVEFASWDLPGDHNAERVFSGLMFADWWSYHLALIGRVNPTPVALVEDFKRALTR